MRSIGLISLNTLNSQCFYRSIQLPVQYTLAKFSQRKPLRRVPLSVVPATGLIPPVNTRLVVVCRYEATVFLVMYIIYVLIMYLNPRLGAFFMGRVDEWRKSGENNDGAVKEGNGKPSSTPGLFSDLTDLLGNLSYLHAMLRIHYGFSCVIYCYCCVE